MVKTYKELYDYAYEPLKNLNMADLEARELVALAARLCGVQEDADSVRKKRSSNAPEQAYDMLTQLLEKRLSGMPLAYLLGEWDFYGITLRVTPAVLIPRADTESVVEYAIEQIEKRGAKRILDLCCGSGCIGIAVLDSCEDTTVCFGDIEEGALDITRENVAYYKLENRTEVRELDALDEPPAHIGQFDMIITNPPYISADEMSVLDVEVAAFEPSAALYGGYDGLNFYRTIAAWWKDALVPGGMVVAEIGALQGADVKALFEKNGWKEVEIGRDLAGHDRYVSAVRP